MIINNLYYKEKNSSYINQKYAKNILHIATATLSLKKLDNILNI